MHSTILVHLDSPWGLGCFLGYCFSVELQERVRCDDGERGGEAGGNVCHKQLVLIM